MIMPQELDEGVQPISTLANPLVRVVIDVSFSDIFIRFIGGYM